MRSFSENIINWGRFMLPTTFKRQAAVWGARLEEDQQVGRWGASGNGVYGARWKRGFDLVAALGLLILFLPLITVLMVLAMADGGSPIFAHARVGLGGRTFRCFKIRTMVVDAEARLARVLAEDPAAAAEWAYGFKLRRDPRITALGRVLRRTSLDELPQLWNVVRGDMSLVGPRPVTVDEYRFYGPAADCYARMRPGLTGLWQILGAQRGELRRACRVRLRLCRPA